MRKKKLTFGDISFNTMNYTFFALFTLLCIFPFYYLFINTISNNDLSSKGFITFYPRGIHFNNYIQVFKLRGLGQAALVSLARTAIGTFLSVGGAAFLGYLVTKKEMWGRRFWYRYWVITMYFNAGIIPWFITMRNLKLTNNFLAYVVPGIVIPFYVMLVKTFIESIPASLEESASMDGAGYITIFWHIILPLIKPILATIAIFCAVGQWNSFTDTLFLVSDQKLFTLQFVLYRYLNEATSLASIMKDGMDRSTISKALEQTATSVRTTVSMVVVLPILIVYPYFQRYFVKGIMIGAVKG